MTEFYEGVSESTDAMLKKAQQYVNLALKLGDAIHLEGGNRVVIQLLKKKPDELVRK